MADACCVEHDDGTKDDTNGKEAAIKALGKKASRYVVEDLKPAKKAKKKAA